MRKLTRALRFCNSESVETTLIGKFMGRSAEPLKNRLKPFRFAGAVHQKLLTVKGWDGFVTEFSTVQRRITMLLANQLKGVNQHLLHFDHGNRSNGSSRMNSGSYDFCQSGEIFFGDNRISQKQQEQKNDSNVRA